MITSAQMYWITRLDGFHLVAGLAIFPSMAFAAVFAVIGLVKFCNDFDDEDGSMGARMMRRSMRVFAICVVAALLESFLPTTREMAAIAIVPRIAANEQLKEAGNRLFELAAAWMEELAPKKKGGAR